MAKSKKAKKVKKSKKQFNKKIYVFFKDGSQEVWKPQDYTDYLYDGRVFVVIKGKAWVDIIDFNEVYRVKVR